MKIFLFLLIVAISTKIFAQPSLTYSLAPQPTNSYFYRLADTSDVWTHASNNSWNFNFLNYPLPNILYADTYLQMGFMPFDTAFSNANLVSTEDFNTYNYYHLDSNSFVAVGRATNSTPPVITKYIDSFKILDFPFTNGNSFTDTSYSLPYVNGSYLITFSCSNHTFCDTIGTLQIGNQSYNNILLLRSNQFAKYDYGAGISTTISVSQFTWFDCINKFPMLDYNRYVNKNSWDSLPTYSSSVKVKDGLITSSMVKPITDLFSFQIDNEKRKIMIQQATGINSIQLYDLHGNCLKTILNSNEISTSNYSDGLYILEINFSGKVYHRKFVIY